MRKTIYIEKDLLDDPILAARVDKCLFSFRDPRVIYCDSYQEIFSRKQQNFRLQKQNPALILAKKRKEFLHAIPEKFGIGSKNSYYFSHLFNCPFDCSYCFLQGMYSSAHFVWFINYEDFQNAIDQKGEGHFFSGYDGDSLALEKTTGFLHHFLPFFAKRPQSLLEVRTKSAYIKPFLCTDPIANCVIAWSLNPENIIRLLEKKTASLEKRLQAMEKVAEKGWKIGLRFDPLMYQKDFLPHLDQLFQEVFTRVQERSIHSVTLGSFRVPKSYLKLLKKNTQDPRIFAGTHLEGNTLKSLWENECIKKAQERLENYIPKEKLFVI